MRTERARKRKGRRGSPRDTTKVRRLTEVDTGAVGPMVRQLIGAEWSSLIVVAGTEQVAQGLYTPAETDALQDPRQHESSWLPADHEATLVDLGVDVDGQIVAFIFVQRRDDGVAVLESLFVHPDHRSAGYARLLVRAAVEAARGAGLETVEVFAMDREPRAIAFWRHLLGTPPNRKGMVQMPGGQLTAQGWRLDTAAIDL